MLRIKILSNDELIKYLTDTNGVMKDNDYLITISYPDTVKIVGNKTRIISDTFTPEDVTEIQLENLLKQIDFMLDEIISDWSRDSYLYINSPDKNVSYNLGLFIYAEFPLTKLKDAEFNEVENFPDLEEPYSELLYRKLSITLERINVFKLYKFAVLSGIS